MCFFFADSRQALIVRLGKTNEFQVIISRLDSETPEEDPEGMAAQLAAQATHPIQSIEQLSTRPASLGLL